MSETEQARIRYTEADAVERAYALQVARARQAWRSAPSPEIAARAKRRLTAATIQHGEAIQQRADAFNTWHTLNTAGGRRRG